MLCTNISTTLTLAQHHDHHADGGSLTLIKRVFVTNKDASWILTSSVIIFTMQTGFGMYESGCVTPKNEVNVMMKNALDVACSGLTYWIFGFGLSFGIDGGTNAFAGVGCFLVNASGPHKGEIYSVFLFQLAFATSSATIVSGAMVERTSLRCYVLHALFSTVFFSLPTHWLWSELGFLRRMGVVDIAGGGPVHLVGGTVGLVATLLLGPRDGAFTPHKTEKPPLPSPIKAILGMFMLWWGWIRLCSGSVFVVTAHDQWFYAVNAAVNAMIASIGGGIASIFMTWTLHYFFRMRKYDVATIILGILSSLVSVTPGCSVYLSWHAFLIGAVAAIAAKLADLALWRLHVDDPVGVIPTHLVGAVWGSLAVGLFMQPSRSVDGHTGGLFICGRWSLLGTQAVGVASLAAWAAVVSFVFFKVVDVIVGLRIPLKDERRGIDAVEHGIYHVDYSSYLDDAKVEAIRQIISKDCEDRPPGSRQSVRNRDHFKPILLEMFKSCERHELGVVMKPSHSGDTSVHLSLSLESSDKSNTGLVNQGFIHDMELR